MLKKLLAFFFLMLFLLISPMAEAGYKAYRGPKEPPAPTLPRGSEYITLMVQEKKRHYVLHRSLKMDGDAPLPLLLAFHGSSGTPARFEGVTALSKLVDKEKFLVIYPEGLNGNWRTRGQDEAEPDIAYIKAVLDDAKARVKIDAKRIYAVGYSNGAQMVWRLACLAPETLSGMALVAGNYMAHEDCKTGAPLSTLLFHGMNDRSLPYEGSKLAQGPRVFASSRAKLNGCTDRPRIIFQEEEVVGEAWENCSGNAAVQLYTIKDKGHSWPGAAHPDATTTISASELIWRFLNPPTAQPASP